MVPYCVVVLLARAVGFVGSESLTLCLLKIEPATDRKWLEERTSGA